MTTSAAGDFYIAGALPVHRLGFGTNTLPDSWGSSELEGPKATQSLLRRVIELGLNLIDTAITYGPEPSESLIADALFPYPAGLVIATKGGLQRDQVGSWLPDGRPEHIKQACETSLRRLRLETIDLYQLHAVDPAVPIEDSVGALNALRASGKIRYVGLCNVDIVHLRRAQKIEPVASVQNRYNLGDRASEELLSLCEEEGIAFIAHSPLAYGGLAERSKSLSRRLRGDGRNPTRSALLRLATMWPSQIPLPQRSQVKRRIWSLMGPGGQLELVARNHAASPAQIALAWLLQHSSTTIPIPGTTSMTHLQENVAATRIQLSDDELQLLGG